MYRHGGRRPLTDLRCCTALLWLMRFLVFLVFSPIPVLKTGSTLLTVKFDDISSVRHINIIIVQWAFKAVYVVAYMQL